MQIPVRFPVSAPDSSAQFLDPEVLDFLREEGLARGGNVDFRAVSTLFRRACQVGDSFSPSVEHFRIARHDLGGQDRQVARAVGFFGN